MDNDPIDLGSLLAPLETGEQGAGTDLRTDFSSASSYQRLRDARASARSEERARDSDDDSEGAMAEGWRDVLSVGQKALATQSKDFEIAAWLTEALVRNYGWSGLSAGAKLISGLCETFWDTGFPQPDEDGMEVRASPIGGLAGAGADGTIMQPLRRLPIFRRADGSGLGLYQWEQAEQTAALSDERREARYAAGAPELKTLVAEARLDKTFLAGTWRGATAALQAWRELELSLDARFGSDAPSTRNVRTLLERVVEVATKLGGAPAETAAESVAQGEATAEAAGSAGSGSGTMSSREEALRELDRIADYFRRAEPHSPLAYTLEEAVRRGKMNFAELLAEVLPDVTVRNEMIRRLGMKADEQ
jgi:type VI secretion system protein ImpA